MKGGRLSWAAILQVVAEGLRWLLCGFLIFELQGHPGLNILQIGRIRVEDLTGFLLTHLGQEVTAVISSQIPLI